MASIRKRTKKDKSKSYMVRWRDPKKRSNQGLTVGTLVEAETLKRLLDANGQSFEIAQHAILSNEKRTPTVAEAIQEHIDLLIRPSSGTTKTYQTMLDLHIRNPLRDCRGHYEQCHLKLGQGSWPPRAQSDLSPVWR